MTAPDISITWPLIYSNLSGGERRESARRTAPPFRTSIASPMAQTPHLNRDRDGWNHVCCDRQAVGTGDDTGDGRPAIANLHIVGIVARLDNIDDGRVGGNNPVDRQLQSIRCGASGPTGNGNGGSVNRFLYLDGLQSIDSVCAVADALLQVVQICFVDGSTLLEDFARSRRIRSAAIGICYFRIRPASADNRVSPLGSIVGDRQFPFPPFMLGSHSFWRYAAIIADRNANLRPRNLFRRIDVFCRRTIHDQMPQTNEFDASIFCHGLSPPHVSSSYRLYVKK